MVYMILKNEKFSLVKWFITLMTDKYCIKQIIVLEFKISFKIEVFSISNFTNIRFKIIQALYMLFFFFFNYIIFGSHF